MAVPMSGDLFSLLDLETRVLLNVEKQCRKTRLLLEDSPLFFYSSCVLIEVSHKGRVVIPGVWVESAAFRKLKAAGSRAVRTNEVEFPVSLTILEGKTAIVRGEVRLPLPIEASEYEQFGVRETIVGENSVAAEGMRLAGREEALEPSWREKGIGALARSDLRFSPHRKRIESLAPEAFSAPYRDWARQFSLDLDRFYT